SRSHAPHGQDVVRRQRDGSHHVSGRGHCPDFRRAGRQLHPRAPRPACRSHCCAALRIRRWAVRLPWWRKSEQQAQLEDEIQSHLQMAASDRVERGESPKKARQAVHREFGNVGLVQQVTRDQWGWRWLEGLLQDLRYGARMLRQNPGFTFTAVLTLALGIGANTAIFSVVYTVLMKNLPYPQSDRLVMVYEDVRLPNYQNERNEPSPGNFSDWAKQNAIFENTAAYRNRSWNLTSEGEPI